MSMTPEAIERTIANLDANKAAVLAEAVREEQRAEASADAAEIKAASGKAVALRQDAERLAGYIDKWRVKLTIAKAQREESRFRAEEVEADKASAALARRLEREYPRLSEPLRALIDELKVDRERIARLNARRIAARLPGLLDAEERVRQRPSRTIPARYGDDEHWVDENGRRVGEYYPQPDGTARGRGGGLLRRVTTQYVISPEYPTGPTMPERLADAVVLPPLKEGEQ